MNIYPITADCNAGTYLTTNGCEQCPVNSFSAVGATSCTSCPTGYTSNVGSTSIADCLTHEVAEWANFRISLEILHHHLTQFKPGLRQWAGLPEPPDLQHR